jgi:hypothetical protein
VENPWLCKLYCSVALPVPNISTLSGHEHPWQPFQCCSTRGRCMGSTPMRTWARPWAPPEIGCVSPAFVTLGPGQLRSHNCSLLCPVNKRLGPLISKKTHGSATCAATAPSQSLHACASHSCWLSLLPLNWLQSSVRYTVEPVAGSPTSDVVLATSKLLHDNDCTNR